MKYLALTALLIAAMPAHGQDALTVPVTLRQWQQKLTSYPPDIVVVDFWATWCTSCLERFPKMVALHGKYGKQGVRFVSLLLEDPEDDMAIAWAHQFLARQNASFEHYRMQENLMHAFEQLDLIGIPVVTIYARDGQLLQRLTGDDPNNQFNDADVEAAILKALDTAP